MKSYKKMFFLYLGILILLYTMFTGKTVLASDNNKLNKDSFERYNSLNTCIKNEYNITGKLLQVNMYNNYYTVITDNGTYIIQNHKVYKYNYDNLQNIDLKNTRNHIYISGINDEEHICNYVIDKKNKNISVGIFNGIESLYKENINLKECMMDSNNNLWVSMVEYNENEVPNSDEFMSHKLLKFDENKTFVEYGELRNPPEIFYKEAFTDLKENNDKIWFKVNKQHYNENENEYMLGRISEDGEIKYYNFHNPVMDYEITENKIWTLLDNECLVILNMNGDILEKYYLQGVTDITKDKNDSIWILQNKHIKKYEKGAFIEKFNIESNCSKLNIYDDNHICTFGFSEYTVIENNISKDVFVDSYIEDNTFVSVFDNDILILNAEKDNLKVPFQFRDNTLVVTNINENGVFDARRIDKGKYIPYYYSKTFNDEIYIPCMNKIFRIKNESLDEYVILFEDECNNYSNKYLKQIQVDNYNNIYAISEDTLYLIHNGKVISEMNINRLTEDNKFAPQKMFISLFKDTKNKIYVSINDCNKQILYKINFNNNDNEISFNLKKVDGQEKIINDKKYYPSNIFINNYDEIEMVYEIDGIYKIFNYNRDFNEDIIFRNCSSDINRRYTTITSMVTAGDGTIFVIMDENVLYAKKPNEKDFIKIFDQIDCSYVTSIAQDNKGGVYIGTYDNGVYYYKHK